MEKTLQIAKLAITAVGGFIATALGGWDDLMVLLIILIGFDIITGIIKSCIKKTLSSNIMFWGMVKKASIFFIIIVAVQLDKIILDAVKNPIQFHEIDIYIRNIFVIYFCLEEFLSLLENLCDIGVPFPKWLHNILKQVEATASGKTTPTIVVNWFTDVLKKIGVPVNKDFEKYKKDKDGAEDSETPKTD